MQMVDVFDQLANIAQIVRRCPTITLSRAYVRAYRDFCSQTMWLKTNIPGATEAGVRQYNLGSDTFVEIIGVRALQGSWTPAQTEQFWSIAASDSSQWDPNMKPGQPVRFTYIPHGQIALDPIPKQVYNLLVSAVVQPKSETVTQIPSECLVKYSNEIEAGALAYLLSVPGQPWSNPALAQVYKREFSSAVANAKADVQRGFQMGSQRVRPRGFVR